MPLSKALRQFSGTKLHLTHAILLHITPIRVRSWLLSGDRARNKPKTCQVTVPERGLDTVCVCSTYKRPVDLVQGAVSVHVYGTSTAFQADFAVTLTILGDVYRTLSCSFRPCCMLWTWSSDNITEA